jgi:hypothetical protein
MSDHMLAGAPSGLARAFGIPESNFAAIKDTPEKSKIALPRPAQFGEIGTA